MTRTVYKRCSVTLDLGTIQRCKELANVKGQSVSSLIRYLVAEASEEATVKRVRREIGGS
jgi:hypothetical protein